MPIAARTSIVPLASVANTPPACAGGRGGWCCCATMSSIASPGGMCGLVADSTRTVNPPSPVPAPEAAEDPPSADCDPSDCDRDAIPSASSRSLNDNP